MGVSTVTAILLQTFTGDAYNFGFGVSLGPDADGDGAGDLLVGSWSVGNHLFSGATGAQLCSWAASDLSAGTSVSLGPDADGDGLAHFVVIDDHPDRGALPVPYGPRG